MRIADLLIYAFALYALSFTSLAVHESAHIYSAQYITKECMFTESQVRMDFLLARRSGMTYFTCSHGVAKNAPQLALNLSDPTAPVISLKVAEASGIRQISTPLATGWFTALMGPALEIAYLAIATDWLSKSFSRLRGIKAAFPVFLVLSFLSSISDLQQALPRQNAPLFLMAYLIAYALAGLIHLTLNRDYYRSLWE
jgi:hypothetical protein